MSLCNVFYSCYCKQQRAKRLSYGNSTSQSSFSTPGVHNTWNIQHNWSLVTNFCKQPDADRMMESTDDIKSIGFTVSRKSPTSLTFLSVATCKPNWLYIYRNSKLDPYSSDDVLLSHFCRREQLVVNNHMARGLHPANNHDSTLCLLYTSDAADE